MSRFVRFQSTIWTMIRDAKEDAPGAFDSLVRLYREPVRRFLRSRNIRRELAEDLVQEVFLRVFQKDLLQKVEKSKGKFRSFLLGVTNNIIRESVSRAQAAKRGGSAVHVPLEASGLDVAAKDESDFEREWMLHLVRLSMKSLAASKSEAVRRDLAIFRKFMRDRPTYEELQKEFKVTSHGVKNALYETRRRIKKEVESLVNSYTVSSADFEEEMSLFDSRAKPTLAGKGKS
jgi:RNA polymerase sigma-70 factor (ECF subfamily)